MYKVGDVVLVEFPFSDIKASKKRPAIIVDVIVRNEYTICKITSVNRSSQNRGYWIKQQTTESKEMGLLTDSFINLDDIIDVHEYSIYRKIGECPFIDKILSEIIN